MVIIEPFNWIKSTAFKERLDLANKLNDVIATINSESEDIDTLKGRMDNIEDTVSSISDDVIEIQGNVDNLSDSMETALNDIDSLENNKQDNLVSGQNIKTVNGYDITGAGNVTIRGTLPDTTDKANNVLRVDINNDIYWDDVDSIPSNNSGNLITSGGVYNALANKEDSLPSKTGNAGKYLKLDSSDSPEWANVEALPTIASGDGGKVLAVNANEDGTEWVSKTLITTYFADDSTDLQNLIENMKNGDVLCFDTIGKNEAWNKNSIWRGLFKVVWVDISGKEIRFAGNCVVWDNSSTSKILAYMLYNMNTHTFNISYYETLTSKSSLSIEIQNIIFLSQTRVYYYNHILTPTN